MLYTVPQSSLTMVLVLVQPFVAVVCEQLVLAKRCVNEAIHKGRGQIHTSRVHLGATASKPCCIHTEVTLISQHNPLQYTLSS